MFHAVIIQHLRMISRGQYRSNHFIDALYYDDQKGERQVIVLCEERILVVNSNSKEVLKDVPAEKLKDIKRGNTV